MLGGASILEKQRTLSKKSTLWTVSQKRDEDFKKEFWNKQNTIDLRKKKKSLPSEDLEESEPMCSDSPTLKEEPFRRTKTIPKNQRKGFSLTNFGKRVDPDAQGGWREKIDLGKLVKGQVHHKMNSLLQQYQREKERIAVEARNRPRKETAMEKRIKQDRLEWEKSHQVYMEIFNDNKQEFRKSILKEQAEAKDEAQKTSSTCVKKATEFLNNYRSRKNI